MNPAKRKKIYRASLAQAKKEEVKVETVVLEKSTPVVETVKETVETAVAVEVNVPLVIIAEEEKEAPVEEKTANKRLKK